MKKLAVVLICVIVTQLSFSQNTILWKVTDTVTHKTSTIVGTFHQFGNTFVDSIPQIKMYLYQSDLAIFESINTTEQTQKLINSRESSKTIEREFSKKDFAKLQEITKDWGVDIYKLKPIELKWKLQQEFQKIKCETNNPLDTWTHFDNYLMHLATGKGVEVLGLETNTSQLEFINQHFGNPKWKDEKKNIRSLLNMLHGDTNYPQNCQLAKDYRNFRLDYEFDVPCKNDILVKQRNENWMQVLPDLLKNKNCFLAVGFMHLKNSCGLLEQLKNMGFIVEPIVIEKR